MRSSAKVADQSKAKPVVVPAELTPDEAFREAARLHDAGQYVAAEGLLRDAIARNPANPWLRNARGVMFAAMKRHLDAVWCYRDALACDANGSGTWTNLGNALTQLHHLKAAVACHRRAIALSDGHDALLHHNLGASLSEAGQHGEAVLAYTRAIELKPDYDVARLDRALAYLYLANYRQGWTDYESRKVTGHLPTRELPGREWDGQPYPGRRLVLIAEQGFGDMLWVARYFPRVKALGGELVIECRPELLRLIAGMGVADRLVPRGDALPPADLHCYICSLPGLFTQDVASIPKPPYLPAPRNDRRELASLFAQAGSRFKVGIVWSGSVTFGKNHRRAQRLMQFFQAFAIPGVRLYSLQKGPPVAELKCLPRGGPIVDLDPYLKDFADTATAIAQLDLVIMTDSAVAHLSGALGKPVWILLGHNAHWLWLLDRADSPWYPSVRLFRPRAEGDWNYVFDSAAAELMTLAKY
jgi:tetratricopeptide (TPR) repeat protein